MQGNKARASRQQQALAVDLVKWIISGQAVRHRRFMNWKAILPESILAESGS